MFILCEDIFFCVYYNKIMGGGQTRKFCRCIKAVRKTIKARQGSTKEKGAIAICVKSVLQTKGRTLKKFQCRKPARVTTQKKLKGGGEEEEEEAYRRFVEVVENIESLTTKIMIDARIGDPEAVARRRESQTKLDANKREFETLLTKYPQFTRRFIDQRGN